MPQPDRLILARSSHLALVREGQLTVHRWVQGWDRGHYLGPALFGCPIRGIACKPQEKLWQQGLGACGPPDLGLPSGLVSSRKGALEENVFELCLTGWALSLWGRTRPIARAQIEKANLNLEATLQQVLATLYPSAARRLFGLFSLFAIGIILLAVAFTHPPTSILWLIFLLIFGCGALAWGEKMRRDTKVHLELTEEELRDSNGRVLAKLSEIDKIDYGTFAIKPSSGFRLRLKEPKEKAWAPGLWWRFSRNVGVGGIARSSEAKHMAQTITALLSERR